MTYFKVVQASKVISVGSAFLKWNTNKHRLFICNVDEGQFVQTFDEKYIFRDTWMKQPPAEAKEYPYANIIIIDKNEYDDLKPLFEEVDHIDIQEQETVQLIEPVQAPQTEQPMSISEMRETLIKQQEQIDSLMQKLSE